MPIATAIPVSAKVEFLDGIHAADDDYYLALLTSAADAGPTTERYPIAGEVVGQGYLRGGRRLTGRRINKVGGSAVINFDAVVWTNADITARGVIIYNASKGGRVLGVADLGVDRQSVNGPFRVEFTDPGFISIS